MSIEKDICVFTLEQPREGETVTKWKIPEGLILSYTIIPEDRPYPEISYPIARHCIVWQIQGQTPNEAYVLETPEQFQHIIEVAQGKRKSLKTA